MKKNFSTIILILVFFVGLSLLLYPSISNCWNSHHQSHAIEQYLNEVEHLDKKDYAEMLKEAHQYNEGLLNRSDAFSLSEQQKKEYKSLLNPGGTGIMGYIEIPKIDVRLPVYHGVDEGVLQIAAGHMEWSSLPVGGKNTHCVISGHRGLPSSMLFTHLDKLKKGDVFVLRVLNEILTYEVDQIRIVEPDELQELVIQENMDLCTLVTCTPYGINSHRLLVRGHRTENGIGTGASVSADAMQIDPVIVASVLAVPVLLVLFVILLLPKRKR